MPFIIRAITPDDAGEVTRLSRQLGYDITEDATRRNIASINNPAREAAWMAWQDGTAAGWIHVFSTTRIESGTSGEISGLVVNEQYRRMGAGKAW